MTEKFNLEAWTKPETLSFADIDKPWGPGSERFHIDALGHEENPVGGNRWKAGYEILNFGQIVFG